MGEIGVPSPVEHRADEAGVGADVLEEGGIRVHVSFAEIPTRAMAVGRSGGGGLGGGDGEEDKRPDEVMARRQIPAQAAEKVAT